MYDVLIIGSGPAGLTAAIYATRASLKTLLIAGEKWGGQLMLTSVIENYPGFPEGIEGPELMANMRKQAERFGTEIVESDFVEADFTRSLESGQSFTITAGEKIYQGRSIIIASGADARWLNVPGEKELIGKGISSCATCDAPFFRNKNVVIVGGGDSAMEEALVLAKVANNVTIIHRRDSFRASQIMQERVKNNPKITLLLNSQVTKVQGKLHLEMITMQNILTNEEHDLPMDGLFVAIGHIPNTGQFKGIDRDKEGYIIVKDHTRTNIPGVFVAGDVHDRNYRQAVTAAGFGCASALETEKWLAATTDVPVREPEPEVMPAPISPEPLTE